MNSARSRLPILFSILSALPALAQPAAPLASADRQALEIGRAYQRFQDQLRAIYAATPDTPAWWKAPPGSYSTPGQREKIAQAQRDFHAAIREFIGSEPIAGTGRDSRYSFLPESKQILAAQIDQSYAERTMELRREAPNVRLPADAEKMKQLSATRERELAAVLTPAELEMLEMRSSQSSATIRQRFAEAIESEDEFRKVFLIQKAFDEKFPIEDAIYSSRQQELMRQRNEAERKLMDDIRDAVGEERFVLYRRAMDQDFQSFRAIARRLALPDTAVEGAMKIRDYYAMQSLTINAETSLNSADRRALIQDLAKEARKELTGVLTAPGLEAYSARAQWLRYLEQGTAFSTNPKDSASSFGSVTQSTYMVMPGGMTMVPPPGTASPAPATPPPARSSSPVRPARPGDVPGANPGAKKRSGEKAGPSSPDSLPPAKPSAAP